MDKFSNDLESYLTERGLPTALPRCIDQYVNMPRSELSSLSTEDLGEIQFEILSYAYYLQNLNNQQVAKAEKCKGEIEKLIAPVLDNYRNYYHKEEKMMAAINDNEHAFKFREIEINARVAATRTSYLTQRLENLAKCLESIARRRHNG